MDQLDKVIQQTIYSINPSTKLPYAAGFVQVADGNGARVFTNAVTVASLTVPTIAIGTPSYLTIAGSQNAYPPVGTITLYGGTLVPAGWLQCDGTTPLRTDYPALYAVLGIIYGAATGTTFKLPGPTQLPLIPGAPPLGMYIIKT